VVFDDDPVCDGRLPMTLVFCNFAILPNRPGGQGSDKVEKVYVFEGRRVKKSAICDFIIFKALIKSTKQGFFARRGGIEPCVQMVPQSRLTSASSVEARLSLSKHRSTQ
jgi:hypothetical protein